MTEPRKKILTLENLLSASGPLVTAALGIFIYFNGSDTPASRASAISQRVDHIEQRVTALEYSDRDQEQHFARIEQSQSQARLDTKEALDKLQSGLDSVNKKLDDMRDQSSHDSAGVRPETRRWTR